MTKVDLKVKAAVTQIEGLNEHFKHKQNQIFQNITKVGNLRNEVSNKVDAFAKTLQVLHDNFNKIGEKNETDMVEMKRLINEEMKDMRAANQMFTYELDRNQSLFRSL